MVLGKIEPSAQDIIFRSFSSGSSGNCYFLGTYQSGILIDAGISARNIQKGLREMGLDYKDIQAVIITHDHADHIRAVGTLGEKCNLPIYATPLIHEGIDRNYGVHTKLRCARRFFNLGEEFTIGDMTINTFAISHDSTQCVSYIIRFHDQYFMIATDVGSTNEELAQHIRMANHLVIEANHDEQMLLNGPYPTYLKQRILSPTGHMSNAVCGKIVAENFHDGLKNIFLCHLSNENNDPKVAYDTIRECLAEEGVVVGEDVNLTVLPRITATETFKLHM